MTKHVLWASLFALIAALLQSTILGRIAVYHAVPDLMLGIIVYTAYNNGVMTGQVTGFCSGLLLDFMSASPLGLNALLRTVIGASAGLMHGTFFLDTVFLPMILCAAATLFKAAFLGFLHLVFSKGVPVYILETPTFWIEIIVNAVSAPFLFGFLKLFKSLLIGRRET
jgi:rod shape-determining protein MreD